MKRSLFALPPLCILLLLSGGCAKKHVLAKNEPLPQPVKVEEPKPEPTVPFMASGAIRNAIVAFVNDDIITLFEVNREAQPVIREAEKKQPLSEADRSRIRRQALDGLIEKKLIEQKIRELHISVGDEEINQAVEDVKRQNSLNQEGLIKALAAQGIGYDQYRSQLREQLERLRLVSMEVRSKIQVGETETRAYYSANQEKYREDDTFRARHIFFKTSDKDSPEEIRRTTSKALAVLAEARSGKDFAELARSYSEDPAARKDGGDLGSFKKGDMQPELERIILALKPGEVSELAKSAMGLHIIKLETQTFGKFRPFESVKAEIEETLYRKKSEERFNKWAKELRGKANVELKELPGIL